MRLPVLLVRVLVALLIASGLLFSFQYFPLLVSVIAQYAIDYPVGTAMIYVAVTAAAIVVLPLSSMPLIPIAAAAWGITIGGILSILGWWIGAVIAFLIARYLGRPVLVKLVSPERLQEWENRIPRDTGFLAIVIIRMIFPVEIPSYVLGLTKAVSFRTYALASLIGMTPFAFVILSMGSALARNDWIRLSLMGIGVSVAIFALRRLYVKFRDGR